MSREARIGLLALISIGSLVWGYKFLKGKNLFKSSYTFYVEYKQIDGLNVSTPVFINGMEVGTVQDIYLKPDNQQIIIVVLDVTSKVKIPKNTIAEITSTGFMGGKALNLVFGYTCTDDCAVSGDYLIGRTKGMLQSMFPEDQLTTYSGFAKGEAKKFLDSLDQKIEADQGGAMVHTLHDARVTALQAKLMTTSLNSLTQATTKSIEGTIKNLESITQNIKSSNDKIAALIKNTEAITADLNKAQLSRTVKNVDTTLELTQDAIVTLKQTLKSSTQTIKELEGILHKVKSGEGTLGKLANDEALYNNLNRTIKNLDIFLTDFRLNPKRYVNVSVFGKKQKQYELPSHDPALPILDSVGLKEKQ